jgi:hypothetical protein
MSGLAVHCTERDVLHKGSSSPRGTAAQRGIDKLFTADASCGGMDVIEQLLAADDSRVGMSGLAVHCTEKDVLHKGSSSPRGTGAQREGIDKLFTADDSWGGMEVRIGACSL